jgi:exopolysaccharide biosynthesis protein
MRTALAALALALMPLYARAAELPARLTPPQPFPAILRQAPTFERVAPGVSYGEYNVETLDGPLAIRALAVAPHAESVHVGTVMAHDALASAGERVSDMARRTGAVAGINGDYFDPATNRATNIIVRDGRFFSMPRKRYALVIADSGMPQFVESSFAGQVQLADRTVTLDLVNELPAASAVALLTPEFGTVAARENMTLVALAPAAGTPPFARYRVTSIADNSQTQPAGYYLAIGMDAYARTGVPNAGDVVEATGDLSPMGLDTVQSAIGGGPLLLRDGMPYDDPDGPSGSEYDARNPSSGAAIAADGTLFLFEIDGREPQVSVGVTRAEFAALMRAFGASSGIAFDGGGSSAIVVRDPGQRTASLQNSPSDGFERPVSNGLFVYSTAPIGAPSQIVGDPQTVRTLVGGAVRVQTAIVDAAQHALAPSAPIAATVVPATLGTYANGTFVARSAGDGVLRLRSGPVTGTIALHVANTPARLVILPLLAHVADNGSLQLRARAFDAQGYPLALPDRLPWATSSGAIDPNGTFTAQTRDANVSLALGGRTATQRVLVGSQERPLAFAQNARFATIPRGGAGSALRDSSCECVQLTFALGPDSRAAYALADLPLPQNTIALSFDVRDDGSGANLRLALRNSLNQQVLVNGITLDHPGWRHLQINLPATVTEPARLSAIYVIGPKGTNALSGSIVIRNVHAVVAGSTT